jgi:hypothetical protein
MAMNECTIKIFLHSGVFSGLLIEDAFETSYKPIVDRSAAEACCIGPADVIIGGEYRAAIITLEDSKKR